VRAKVGEDKTSDKPLGEYPGLFDATGAGKLHQEMKGPLERHLSAQRLGIMTLGRFGKAVHQFFANDQSEGAPQHLSATLKDRLHSDTGTYPRWLSIRTSVQFNHPQPQSSAISGPGEREPPKEPSSSAHRALFGAQQNSPGGRIVRTIGIARARAKIGLQNLAYNIRRLVTLERIAAA
jgi:hypothetical protein